MVGQSISHYRIVDQLGHGGMGIVYRAQDMRLRRPVALKFFPRELADDAEAVKRFEREARAASALDHPNICTVYEVDEAEDGRTFIAMACYDGTTLKQRIAEGPLSTDEIVRIASQIAAGLSEAHRKGIVHRDLKPANIIITLDGVVKIVDFGLALLSGESRITEPDATAGTPSYMAPEQVRGEKADHRADVWALGALLYEMATGQPAFSGEYVHAVLYKIIHTDPELIAEIPEPLRSVISRCLEKRPEDRFESMADVRDALPAPAAPERSAAFEGRTAANLARDGDSGSWNARISRIPASVAAGIIVLAVLLMGDLVRFPSSALLGWFSPEAEMGELHVAVLPLRVIGSTAQSDAYARGLAEVVTGNLTQLEPYSETSFWIVPTSEILRREVTSADEARKLFGVNYVLDGALQHDGSSVRLTLNLTDARRLRQLDTWTADFSGETPAAVQDEAALQAARMLKMNIPSDARETIRKVGTADLGANEFYIQARGYLQRFDDVSNIRAALTLFHKALEEDSAFILATAGLAEAHWRMYHATKNAAHADSALVYGRRVESAEEVPTQVFVSLGLVYLGTGRTELARETFEKALSRDPAHVAAQLGRAQALADEERTADAEAAYLEAIRLKPDYWASYHELALFYYRQGEFEKAAEQFRKEIQLTPDNAYAHSNLGGIYFYLGRWDEAERHFRRAIELQPMYRAYSNLGTLSFHQERFDEATSLFRHALEIESSDYAVWAYLGMAHLLSGRSDSADVAFRRAIALAEDRLRVVADDVETLASIAMYRAILGDAAEATSLLDRVAQHDATDEWIAFQIGQAYEILGRREEAIEWINVALETGLPPVYVANNVWLSDIRSDPRLLTAIPNTDR